MDRVLSHRVKGLPVSLYIIAFFAAMTAWLASADTTNCALAASCQTTDDEVFGAGATFNDDRGSAADNDVVIHGDTVDELVDVDASADTTFFSGTVDGSGAIVVGFSNLVGITEITATGTYNVPTGVGGLVVACVGGGASGTGWDSTAPVQGSGGGAGGTGWVFIDSPAAPYAVTIGDGGTAVGLDTDGDDGNPTSFGADCVASGGAGGLDGSIGGIGGGCSAADYCILGDSGETVAAERVIASLLIGGYGGASAFGPARNGPGNKGSGGSGANSAASPTSFDGGDGYVVVYELN